MIKICRTIIVLKNTDIFVAETTHSDRISQSIAVRKSYIYIYIYNITANFLKMEESRDERGGKVIIAFEDFATFENFPLVPSFEVKLQEKLKVYIFLTMSRVTPSFPVVSTFSRVLDRFPLSLPSLLPSPIFQNILPSSSRFF